MKVLVTGSRGFIGSHFVDRYQGSEILTLSEETRLGKRVDEDPEVCWLLDQSTVVVHLAGLAHGNYSQEELLAHNHDATISLAKEAAKRGNRRFIYISSVSVYGSGPHPQVYREDSNISITPGVYSKANTEDELFRIARSSSMEVVVLRSPLVYGPGVKANFLNLLELCRKNYPLPFNLVNNCRSFVYVKNLVDCIVLCIDHEEAAGNIFLVSDMDDVSLKYLVSKIRALNGRSPNLWSVPPVVLEFLAKVIGKEEMLTKLIGDFSIDSSKISRVLGWNPQYSFDDGITETVCHYTKRLISHD